MNSTNKYKSSFSFAVIKDDKSIVTWGSEYTPANKYVPINADKIKDINDAKQIVSTDWGAFAVLREDNSVVTWGSASYGGDSSKVTSQLANVEKIYSNAQAFVAVKDAGKSVIAWGNAINGGDISKVTGLNDVKEIYSTATAFAALKNDGSVVTWGNPSYGGTIPSNLTTKLDGIDGAGEDKDVTNIFATNTAFAALHKDGSVTTWGSGTTGGIIPTNLTTELDGIDAVGENKDVTEIFATNSAFAALHKDGTVVTWGDVNSGGTVSSDTQKKLIDVKNIVSTDYAFVAVLKDNSVITWGNSLYGGGLTDELNTLQNLNTRTPVQEKRLGELQDMTTHAKTIYSTGTAFAEIKNNDSVVTWGNSQAGGGLTAELNTLQNLDAKTLDKEKRLEELKDMTVDVKEIYATYNSFAALKKDGSVVTWGQGISGGDSKAVAEKLNGDIDVIKIFSNDYSFAALRQDGSVVTWGNSVYGGDSSRSTVEGKLNTNNDNLKSGVKNFADALPNNAPTVSISIDGVPKENEILIASNTLSDLDGLGKIYHQWLRGDVDIKDAIAPTYKLTADDIGKTISVRVSYIDKLGRFENVTSEPTTPVIVTNQLLTGTTNNDNLNGLSGNDTLTGGLGVDTLTGNNGIDVFRYEKSAESTATKPDTITDFSHTDGDKIDLSKIDADSKLKGNQAFTFIEADEFSKTAGQLRFDNGKVEADTNGDGKADFAIILTGVTKLSADDFVL